MLLDLCAPFKRLLALVRPCPAETPPLQPLAPLAALPDWVASDPLVLKYHSLLGDLPWQDFPERPTDRPWPGPRPEPRAPFVAAFLLKLHQDIRSMGKLRTFLLEHPALLYWLGFKRASEPLSRYGLELEQTAPSGAQFSRVLRTLPNPALQFLLSATVQLLRDSLPFEQQADFGDIIAGDTQALLAWVAENNPKQFIKEGRLDKKRQPNGDPDCKLGVKKSRNSAPADADDDYDAPAPKTEAKPAKLQIGVEIFWGYASGVVASRQPDGSEFVLAERTRPFNEDDSTYFLPLMQQVEARLGRRPRFGAWDCAFDAHYVYDYFDQAGGFAAVPFNPGKRGAGRQFAEDGSPLCAAGLAMPRLFLYQDRTSSPISHVREKCGCPLLKPSPNGQCCPIGDPHFEKGGCTTTIALGRGSRIRHTLDRESESYKKLFAKRTMVERINSQAEALGILRPKLRRGRAIANQNTLIYVLINLRVLARLRAATQESTSERGA